MTKHNTDTLDTLLEHLRDIEFYIQRTVDNPEEDRETSVNFDSDEVKDERKKLRESLELARNLMDRLGL